MHFTAINVDIARPERYSICRIGLVRVEGGQMVEKILRIVQPPKNNYSSIQTNIHGMDADASRKAPLWPFVWAEIKSFLDQQLLIAHNAAFHLDCIFHAQHYYRLPYPVYNHDCTYCKTGADLDQCCRAFNLEYKNLDDPLSRAIASADIYLQILSGIEGDFSLATHTKGIAI